MEYEIGNEVSYRLKKQPIPGQINYGGIVDVVNKKYIIEDANGDLIEVTETEVVSLMDSDGY